MSSSSAAELRARIHELDGERRVLENEISAALSQLGPIGMREPLVDGAL
jgi:hypothetical protein